MKKFLALIIAAGTMAACSSNKAPETDMKAVASEPEPVASAPVVASAPEPVVSNHNSVYFRFNKYDIDNEYAGIVKANSDYLATNKDAKVRVEGNTDDIGSVEYNLSLGQKRADAVKKSLIANGATKSQVEATSNGKLKAKYDNNSSATRAMNRRSDINYSAAQPAGYNTDSNGLPVVDGSVFNGTVTEGIE